MFIGGGYISFEFAHLAARYGRKVTIIHRGEDVLKKFDPDLVVLLVRASEKLGITVAINLGTTCHFFAVLQYAV